MHPLFRRNQPTFSEGSSQFFKGISQLFQREQPAFPLKLLFQSKCKLYIVMYQTEKVEIQWSKLAVFFAIERFTNIASISRPNAQ
jgi:hypothetical protein